MNFIDYHLEFAQLTNRSRTSRIVVHHSASADVSAQQIHGWHLEHGWSGIGYHFVIRSSGAVELGRPEQTVGAHTLGYNEDSIGLCLTGNFMLEIPGPDQLAALAELIRDLEENYGPLLLQRHSDLTATDCPGDLFPWEQLSREIDQAGPSPAEWKAAIMQRAKRAGLISGPHSPDDPAPKWFVLAVVQNLRTQP